MGAETERPTVARTKLEHALELAEQGFRVFPLAANTKVPIKDMSWKEEATVDREKIKAWWTDNPNCNIGVATGQGVLVLDADTKGGKPGLDSLDDLEVGGLPTSFSVSTPSGGRHVYLKTDQPHRNSVDKLANYPGIDIRSDGGYVVAPGSTIDGKVYEVVNAVEPAAAPEWLHAVLRAAEAPRTPKSEQPLIELDLPGTIARAKDWLTKMAPTALEGDGGNLKTYEVGCKMREFGLSEATALDLMLDNWNDDKAIPPWAPEDLQDIVSNAYQYATGGWGSASALAEFDVVEIDDEPERPKVAAKTFAFTPFILREASEIPPRKWLYDWHYIAGFMSVTVSPGGLGKTNLKLVEALSMATGRSLLGARPIRPLRVVYWNGEDPAEELDRRATAACKHFRITQQDLGDRLSISSGRDLPINFASSGSNGLLISKPDVTRLIEALRSGGTEVLIIDPFVTTHSVPENDNTAINAVASLWREVADVSGCAVELVHHSTKQARLKNQADELGIAQARGAGSLIDAARSARFLVAMTEDEGRRAGIENPRRSSASKKANPTCRRQPSAPRGDKRFPFPWAMRTRLIQMATTSELQWHGSGLRRPKVYSRGISTISGQRLLREHGGKAVKPMTGSVTRLLKFSAGT